MPNFIIGILVALLCSGMGASAAENQVEKKEWTFLVFLNGNNNLDYFGTKDMNEMEQVGSTDKINVVVQWASMWEQDIKRVYVQKDDNPYQVTSPVLETGRWDMGDYKELINFVKWAVKKYPAKKYFIDVWDHGSGWHDLQARIARGDFSAMDISHDDKTGNVITTEQLGLALTEISKELKQKIDIYGSDACLMNMIEVAGEFSNAVSVMVGSQELEPGAGWPYHKLMERWAALGSSTATDVAKILTEEYIKSYSDGGSERPSDVTFSALNLNETKSMYGAISSLKKQIASGTDKELDAFKKSATDALSFYYRDYVDLGDFVDKIEENDESLSWWKLWWSKRALKNALKKYIIANGNTGKYKKSTGVSIWLPTGTYDFDSYAERYGKLKFHKATGWGDAVKQIATH